MRFPRVIGAVVVAAIVGLSLTACDQFLPEPLSFRVVNGEPVVRVCLPLTITRVVINTFAEEDEDEVLLERIEVWGAEGEERVDAGTELILGRTFGNLAVRSGDDVLTELPTPPFNIEIDVTSERGGSWTTDSYFEEDLREGVWVDSDGNEQAVPCTRRECDPGWACHNEWPQPTGEPTRPEPTIVPSPAEETP